jgi:asparagine synthase (glutamine-hydrolysing)
MSILCGWAGNLLPEEESHTTLGAMVSALPTQSSARAILAIGACSALAFIPYGDAGCMYEDDEFCTAVAGYPVFLPSKLKKQAMHQGIAKALLQSYKQHGANVLNFLRGDFCFAVLHKTLGIRSLTYAPVNGGLVFGSSAAAIRKHPRIHTDIDPQVIFNYLYFHVVPAPDCVYRGLKRLLPGNSVMLSRGHLDTQVYWKVEYSEDTKASFTECKEELIDLLERSIRRRALEGNVGCFLSGGTDSSTIAGLLGRITERPARTYSIGFRAEGYDEMHYARVAAQHFGTDHHEYYVAPDDVVKAIPLVAKQYSEPYGNKSAVPTFYCAALAKHDGIDKLLGGDGGDELFGGNERYAKQWVFSLYDGLPPGLRGWITDSFRSSSPSTERLWPVRKLKSYVMQASVPMPERLQTYNLVVRLGPSRILTPEFLQGIDPHQPTILLRNWYGEIHANEMLNRILGLDLKLTLADNDIPKVTQMCELAGVNATFPFLDEDLVAFAARLPVNFKLRRTKLRYFFKKALQDFLPHETISKAKHGFGLPFGLWLRTHEPLKELVDDNLTSLTSRHIVRAEFVRELVDHRLASHPPYFGTMIWILVMLEQWFRHHVD